MQIPNSITPGAMKILSSLGSEEEMEAFIKQFIAASDIYNGKAEKLSGLGSQEEPPVQGSSH
jgi:hypothetical protein